MFKKIFVGISVVMAGMLMVFSGFYFGERRREKAIGGRLKRVNYKFTKEFED
ncbi:stress-responsive transcriptional regulator PspC [Acetobacterium paludosum]|uniref:Stress-responsive transcriptional regulator PspC n=1 Tax=Acetobacterium paludosum TaxID=52693 RepID=A0A923HYV0_9FIRM|nr:stress-responsive transcriptional regulator PspC [Acetobacterium paludosum]MBC3889677.1 stress-responsive transcriptional regulator PspC [Acetobacterium paludosum]